MRWMTVIVESTAITHSTGRHPVEQCADDDQHQAFRALHEADAAGADQRLGAGARIADHDGADHHEGRQHHVEKAVAAGVKDQQSEELGSVTVAVDDRIEERRRSG